MPRVCNKRDRNIPKDAIYIGRPSKWGNPYKIGELFEGKILTRQDAIKLYMEYMTGGILNPNELRGKDLVCWCAPLPCHGDILLKLANA